MNQTLLFCPRRVCDVARVAVGHERSGEVVTENVARHTTASCRHKAEVDMTCGRMHPKIRPPSVQDRIRFVGMDGSVATGNLFRDILDNGLCQCRQFLFKANQRGGGKSNTKQFLDDLWDLAITDADTDSQENHHTT